MSLLEEGATEAVESSGGEGACELMRRLAARTWTDIQDGERTGIRIGEESITDRLLLDIARSMPLPSVVTKWNRFEEARLTGADFDWWFLEPDSGIGVALRIQAKRIDYFNQEFPGLKAGNRLGPQREMLKDSSLRAERHPLYLFYLASSSERTGATACGSHASNETPAGWAGGANELYGCSLTGIGAVEEAVKRGDLSLDFFWPLLLPWSCLICCQHLPGGLIRRVDWLAISLQAGAGDFREGQRGLRSLVTDNIPDEVWAVVNPDYQDGLVPPPDIGATLVTLVPPQRPHTA
jgi:hypothetical protein